MCGPKTMKEEPSSVKPRAPAKPVWRTGVFATEFDAPYTEDMSLGSGLTASGLDIFLDIVCDVIKNPVLSGLSEAETLKVEKICGYLDRATKLDQVLGISPTRETFGEFFHSFVYELYGVKVGHSLVSTSGWRSLERAGYAIMFVISRLAEDEWSLIVVAVGAALHPGSQGTTRMCCRRMSTSRILSRDLWYDVFKMQAYPGEEHEPEAPYQLTLPFLNGDFLSGPDGKSGHFQTIPDAGKCYYRCALAIFKYLMKMYGVSSGAQKRLHWAIRVGYVNAIECDWAKFPCEDFSEFDRHMIINAVEETGFSGWEQSKDEDRPLSKDDKIALRVLLDRVQTKAKTMACKGEPSVLVTQEQSAERYWDLIKSPMLVKAAPPVKTFAPAPFMAKAPPLKAPVPGLHKELGPPPAAAMVKAPPPTTPQAALPTPAGGPPVKAPPAWAMTGLVSPASVANGPKPLGRDS